MIQTMGHKTELRSLYYISDKIKKKVSFIVILGGPDWGFDIMTYASDLRYRYYLLSQYKEIC